MDRRHRGSICRNLVLWFLAASLFLTACTGGGRQDRESASGEEMQEFSERWKQGFVESGQGSFWEIDTSMTPYHMVSRATVIPDEPDFEVSAQRRADAYSDEGIFILQSFLAKDGWSYYLQQYDIQNGSLLSGNQVFQEEKLQGYFESLCVFGEKELAALFVSVDQEGDPQEIRVLTFDSEGKRISSVLLDYEYREPDSGPMMSFKNFLFDGNYFYLFNCFEGGLLVFDREGKEIRRDVPDTSSGRYYTAACSAPDGSVIASKASQENLRTELLFVQGEKERRLGEIFGIYHRVFALGGDGSFYYFDSDRLIRWDTSTGEKKALLDSIVEGVDANLLSAITFSAGGYVFLHRRSEIEKGGLEILTCSEEEVETEENKLVFAVVEENWDLFYRSLPAEYSKDHPENQVKLETHEGDIDAYRTRVMADILSGGGPDILLLENEDVRNLYENGALLDLTEYLDPELKEKIFPGALERGVMDGKLIGVDPQMQGKVMLVSNAVWAGDSWTLEDVVRLADERKPQSLFASASLGFDSSSNSPGTILFWFFSFFPEKSSFLDLEAGTCDFENETFIRFLEICKEYGEKPALEEDQIYEALKTGECFSTCATIMNMVWFSRDMKPLEKSCHFVGFPGQEGYGWMSSSEMLVVNVNTKNREKALEFLWDLFSLKTQQGLSATSVREDVIRESVREKGESMFRMSGPGYASGDGGFSLLEAKEDGSSFLEEYITAIRGLETEDSRAGVIYDIVEEEANLFFEGSKTAEETAKVIQNRVKLYLSENQ